MNKKTLGTKVHDDFAMHIGPWKKGEFVMIERNSENTHQEVFDRIAYGMCADGSSVSYVSPNRTSASFVRNSKKFGRKGLDMILTDDGISYYNFPDQDHRPDIQKIIPEIQWELASEIWDKEVVIFEEFENIMTEYSECNSAVPNIDNKLCELKYFFQDRLSEGKCIVIDVDFTDLDGKVESEVRRMADRKYNVRETQFCDSSYYRFKICDYTQNKQKIVSLCASGESMTVASIKIT